VRALTRISIQSPLFLALAVCSTAACGTSDDPSGSGSATPLSNWTGKTFLLDAPAIKASNWREPKGGGEVISEFVPQLLIGVEAGAGDSLKVTLTTALGNEQDECNTTTEVEVTDATYPEILIAAPDFPIRVASPDPDSSTVVSGTTHNVSLKNVLPGTTTDTPTSELKATLDVSKLYPLAYRIPNATKESVCQTFEDSVGTPCAPCPHNDEPWCITVRAVQVAANEFEKPLKKISSSEIPSSCP